MPALRRRVRRFAAPFARAWRAFRYTEAFRAPRGFTPGSAVPGTVAVYFGDGPLLAYQLRQWLPVLELLHARHPVVIVLRDPDLYEQLRPKVRLPIICASLFADLTEMFRNSDFAVTLYVNNSSSNFHSLANQRSAHVHVSHGESDKLSMASNRIKAYDYAFVAGEAAVRRFQANVLDLDTKRLVRVGRPQLDLEAPAVLAPTDRRTVLYAPTWPGANEGNNYTSVDVYGAQIAAAVLAVPGVRFVYRPHPRIARSRDPGCMTGHRQIMSAVSAARRSDPDAGHHVDLESDILALFDGVDLLISDVSSVALDFLYRRIESPILLTDRRNDETALRRASPLAASVNVINAATVTTVGDLVAAELAADLRVRERTRARDHYFDGLARGESTQRFLAAVEEVLLARERWEAQRRALVDGQSEGVADGGEPHAADRHPGGRAG